MRRLGIRILLSLAASAIGLLLCSILLDDFDVSTVTFPFAVAVFGVVNLIVEPLVSFVLLRWLRGAIGLIALIVNAFTLWLTDVLTTGIDVHGLDTYVLATILIWVVNVVVTLIPGPWRRQRAGRR
ncbi:MAG TPA: phage holin family protein [Gaiellaceae bacterium]|nr:phage holin family protein [Gaiellaceae bacterium]